MSFRERTVIAILLLVARMLCEDPRVTDRIQALANDISVNAPRSSDSEVAA